MDKAKIIIGLLILKNLLNIDALPWNISSFTLGEIYPKVINYSLLFFEAQRSGELPNDNRISWRGDSALDDHGDNGEDLTGGYYDAADYVKFGFTMASTTTLLAWSGISWPQGYAVAGQYDQLCKTIKWATDYFIKCHVADNVFYGQVGSFSIDHEFWGRPEDLNTSRPVFKIDPEHPGSDLAGETAAALAATSILFKKDDYLYSAECLQHARQLYKFADTYRGTFDGTPKNAVEFYQSSGYGDELAWAAAWLFKATGETEYLIHAERHYRNFNLNERPNEFYFDKKTAGVQTLLAQLTDKSDYKSAIRAFCDYSMTTQKRTPKGLVYLDQFGSLRHAANIAFICLQAADIPDISNSDKYRSFAASQIHIMLGSTGRSYVVGWGDNSPKQPYHAASSCPNRPEPCGWEQFDSNMSNPQILYGALVSGPDEIDNFIDKRDEYVYTEVTLEYNAGFTGALSGLYQLYINKIDE